MRHKENKITLPGKLRITFVQTALYWEDADENRKNLTSLLARTRRGTTDLILLPEMFSTGFTMNAPEVAETMNGPTTAWMKDLAASKGAVVCGSIIIQEKQKFYNRLLWIDPGKKPLVYDKRHLFRMAGEHHIFSPGMKRLIVTLNGWRVCPLVCYDLRFPVWSRNKGDYDLLLFVANWPQKRRFAWKQLLVARAIENQCYLAGLNRIGKDGKHISYRGDSVVLDAMGQKISKTTGTEEAVETVTLDYGMLDHLRKSFPVLADADNFEVKM